MGLETAATIDQLNTSNPVATDGLGQADDHIRLIKSAVKSTFPNVTGVVSASHTELNKIDGYTGSTSELNVLDGITASTTELNKLDGVTASTTELNKIDGLTASTAELNKLDGATATTTELNYVDGVTSNIQTQLNSKYVAATQVTGTWQSGTGGTASLVTPADIKAAIIALETSSTPNFTSQVAFTSSVTTATHGLGALPSRWEVSVVCTVANLGYAVDDVIRLTSHNEGSGARGTTVSANATEITVAGSSVFLQQKSGGGVAALTNTDWDLIFEAWT